MSVAAAPFPGHSIHEWVNCYQCGSSEATELLRAEDDLCGTPGSHRFVRCAQCGLAYQNPRLTQEAIAKHYGDDYIAHRKRRWGRLQPLFDRAMEKLDRDKEALVSRYVRLSPDSRVLDAGCGAGTFVQRLRRNKGCAVSGVDFADLADRPALRGVDFHQGLFSATDMGRDRFDLITMWHFLEHDYAPVRSLHNARRALKSDGVLLIEVPRLDSLTARVFGSRWPGLQAPQHTLLLTRRTLADLVAKAGLEAIDYLPYGAFPAYFYLFTGTAFLWRRGRGLNLNRLLLPYMLGQIPALPLILAERRLNLAMQTIVCRPAGPVETLERST